ncbi:cysteine desulfurase family protein [Saccharococcus caldoxylosilyticus]|uniref:cysteine desulfurase n=2 Tax=Saccharococcus caldoxylosilyticus TaxID=81408 RepID=A0A023DB42_9BACL|nr:cysteine desulfurase family protein [Parageobacillus caldoxylosilyticus]OQP05111.1 cysteine desulfurase NifS [Geobacillus sp. 44B]KYD15327.1 Cysteine desulfurase [Parageobacillus caldoxylosilyticus]MBB3850926.1 cysteine desulfurase [Parageobacillus caldoxylosilyticus]QNU36336.1 cysteine desulfurase [Geobacillus sp. 44B]QXJ39411.1 Cysteine desulfurase [Parageobacillus caldoxylosilyticus]
MDRIYLDHAATSPVHPDVVERMIPFMTEVFGNPSSIHYFGRQSRHAVDEARALVAKSIGAKETEVIFTSGGTEADNMALIGTAMANRDRGRHIITTAIEHHAVLRACQYLEKQGFDVTYLPVDEHGKVSPADVKAALRDDTILVSIMFANNEVGVLQPIREIGELLKEHQAYFHTDAVQAYGLVPMDVNEHHIDLLSVSGHKINGPKGIGALYARETVKLSPLFYGGEQERKRRAGTENVAGIAGLAKAVEIAQETMKQKQEEYRLLRETMLSIFAESGIDFAVNGSEDGLPHIVNVAFPGTNVESMLVNLDLAGIAASSGSACTAGSIDPSHVLVAMFGKESERIRSSIRFSFGLGNTKEQIERAATETVKIVKRLTNK